MARDAVTAYIALGANLGDTAASLRAAVAAIATLAGTGVEAVSSLYRSAPIDATGPFYLNAVLRAQTQLPAPVLLQHLQAIEQAAGRTRPALNAPRTLDLDLLLYGEGQIHSPALTVPHPRMHGRAFVLRPLHEIAPEWVPAEHLQRVKGQDIAIFGAF